MGRAGALRGIVGLIAAKSRVRRIVEGHITGSVVTESVSVFLAGLEPTAHKSRAREIVLDKDSALTANVNVSKGGMGRTAMWTFGVWNVRLTARITVVAEIWEQPKHVCVLLGGADLLVPPSRAQCSTAQTTAHSTAFV